MKALFSAFLGFLVLVGACTAPPKLTDDYSKRILGRWLGPRKYYIFHANGTWGVQGNEDAPEDIDGRRWRIQGNKLFITFRGDNGLLTVDYTIVSFTAKSFITEADGHKEVYERAPFPK